MLIVESQEKTVNKCGRNNKLLYTNRSNLNYDKKQADLVSFVKQFFLVSFVRHFHTLPLNNLLTVEMKRKTE